MIRPTTIALCTYLSLSILGACGTPPTGTPDSSDAGSTPGLPSLYRVYTNSEPPLACVPNEPNCPLDRQAAMPAGTGALEYRYVPLCADGTGDHEWTLQRGGRPPSCARDAYVRCVDGSRAVYWLDQAVNASGADITSDQWVFFAQGGANCGKNLTNNLSAAAACARNYMSAERQSMGSATAAPRRAGQGILSATADNQFAAFNRVYVSPCTFDKQQGDREYDTTDPSTGSDADCDPSAPGVQPCRLYFHGRRAWEATLSDLTFVRPGVPTLGAMPGRTSVVFAGNSNGATGMTFNLDWLAARVRALAADATVLGALDDHFNPGLETEAAFGAATPGADGMVDAAEARATGIDEYDHRTTTASSDMFPSGVTPAAYQPGGTLRDQYDAWWSGSTPSEESCVRAHPGAENWRCADEEHVLLNHVTTPVFLHLSLQDVALRNKQVDFSTTLDWVPSRWQARILFRANTYLAERDTAPAVPGACTEARESYPLAFFMPDHDNHVNIIDNPRFFSTCLARSQAPTLATSYHAALFRWVTEREGYVAIGSQFGGSHAAMTLPCP